jgi:hypothetical protein
MKVDLADLARCLELAGVKIELYDDGWIVDNTYIAKYNVAMDEKAYWRSRWEEEVRDNKSPISETQFEEAMAPLRKLLFGEVKKLKVGSLVLEYPNDNELDLLRAANWLQAVKEYRSRTSYGLKEAKDAIQCVQHDLWLCSCATEGMECPPVRAGLRSKK